MRRLLVWLTAAVVWAAGVYGVWVVLRAGARWPAPVPEDREIVTLVPATNLAATLRKTNELPQFVGPIELWNLETGELAATHPLPDDWEDLYWLGTGYGLATGSTKWTDPKAPIRPKDQVIDVSTGRVLISAHLCNSRCSRRVFVAEWFDDAGETITLYDPGTGQARLTLRGGLSFLTHDGRFVVTYQKGPVDTATKYSVWETASGREVGIVWLPPDVFVPGYCWVTADGRHFVDPNGGVWAVATGRRVWQQGECGSGISSEDGAWIIAEVEYGGRCWAAWFDAATGREAVERRLHAPAPRHGFMMSSSVVLFPLGSSGRLAVCRGPDRPAPSPVSQLLAQVFGMPAVSTRCRSIVFDTNTGSVVTETNDGYVLPGFDTGRLLLLADEDDRRTVWRLPPPNWRTRVLAIAVGWGLVVGLVVQWVGRRWMARGERPARAD